MSVSKTDEFLPQKHILQGKTAWRNIIKTHYDKLLTMSKLGTLLAKKRHWDKKHEHIFLRVMERHTWCNIAAGGEGGRKPCCAAVAAAANQCLMTDCYSTLESNLWWANFVVGHEMTLWPFPSTVTLRERERETKANWHRKKGDRYRWNKDRSENW